MWLRDVLFTGGTRPLRHCAECQCHHRLCASPSYVHSTPSAVHLVQFCVTLNNKMGVTLSVLPPLENGSRCSISVTYYWHFFTTALVHATVKFNWTGQTFVTSFHFVRKGGNTSAFSCNVMCNAIMRCSALTRFRCVRPRTF
jgi:hypothetical protein